MVLPTRLGRYAVDRRLGSGGFATVWLAYDEQLDSPVAVKVLADNWTEDEHVRRRFLEEGRYLRRVESPHVVTVYDAGELDDGRPYLVMTYANQGTLADRLDSDRGTGLTVAQSLAVVCQVADGLQALHDHDILHRDVKPANILFHSVRNGADVRAMVGDLGLGKALDISSRLTLIGGTPSYVAPEQAAAEPLDPRADQYSLAALAYLLLAGRPAFSHASLRAAAEPGPLPPLSTGRRPFDAATEEVLRRGLARRPVERYPTVTDFSEALSEALRESAGVTRAITGVGRAWLPIEEQRTAPDGRPEPPRRQSRWWRRVAFGVALAALAAVAGAGTWVLGRDHAASSGSVTVTDAAGDLTVTVPASWNRYVDRHRWVPPGQPDGATKSYPALWLGSAPKWNDANVAAQGVFLGVLPSTRLPGRLPSHPDCVPQDQIRGTDQQGHEQATARYTDCPGGVVIEQATMISRDRLLWVQVHGDSLTEANQVLGTVQQGSDS